MKQLTWACLLYACAALAESPRATPPIGFPVIPPIADADPTDRHPVSLRVPRKLQVERRGESLTVTIADFQTVKLTVGRNMVTGIQCEENIQHGAAVLPLRMTLGSGHTVEPFEHVFTRGGDKIPSSEEKYSVEYEVTIFETDVPAQHLWAPQRGKLYKVLWTHTFKQLVQ
jgi:hypothetical protein